METLGTRLRKAREEKGITQTALASILKINNKEISHYENDKRIPTYTSLIKFADYYNVSIDWLLGRVKEKDSIIMSDSMVKEEYGKDLSIILNTYKKMNNIDKKKFLFVLKLYFKEYFDTENNKKNKILYNQMKKQEIIDRYIKLCYELGKVANKDDVRECTYLCSPDKIVSMFGSWSNFIKETNICKNGETVGMPLKDALEMTLVKKRLELDRRLKSIEFNRGNNLPEAKCLRRLYKNKPLRAIWDEIEKKYDI